MMLGRISGFLDRRYRLLAGVYVVVIALSLAVLLANKLATGAFLPLDVELTGGRQVEVGLAAAPDMDAVQNALPGSAKAKLIPGIRPALVVEFPASVDENDVISSLRGAGISGDFSVRTFGPFLGEVFWRQAQLAVLMGFIAIAAVVFVIFRAPVPSFAIVLAAAADALFALSMSTLLGMHVSLAMVAGLLMLIGYSVDTDIVLTTEVLKGTERTLGERVRTAAKTGLTLTLAALAALATMYAVSGSAVIQQITGVLIIGLLIDIPVTWLGNAGMLRWWMEKKEAQVQAAEEVQL